MKTSRLFNALMALFLVFAAMASVQPAAAQTNHSPASVSLNANVNYVPGELLVQFASGLPASAYSAQASALAGQVNAQVASTNGDIALLSFDESADMTAMGALVAAKSGVKAVSLNYIGHIPEINGKAATGVGDKTKTLRTDKNGEIQQVDKSAFSGLRTLRKGKSTPTYPIEWSTYDTWGWDQIHTPIIWANTVVSPQVCILDTGADILHPDLKGKVLNGKDFVNDDLIANDDNGHGTHVAGIIVANNANKIGVLGVSNGTALAVKVLSGDGTGTTYDLVEGIRYCANLPAVRVMNMSIGGYGDSSILYDALYYAIVTKGKFIVAAAGNEYTSDFTSATGASAFPGAWGSPKVCSDGTYDATETCTGKVNGIHQGMVAVAAGASPYDPSGYDGDLDGYFWVDQNNNSSRNLPGENYYPAQCLADFSNYGDWVEIIAPGEEIVSTVPVSAPYTGMGSFTEAGGYGVASGTSMAAPFVAGAVARLLSAYPTTQVNTTTAANPYTIQDRLLGSGADISGSLAVDTGVTEPAYAYLGADNDFIPPFNTGDESFGGEVPYCVPTVGGNFTAAQAMDNAVYLDVASAMGRTSMTVYVRDATNGLPLTGAKVMVYQGTALKDSAILGNKYTAVSTTVPADITEDYVELTNLPASGADLTVKITKAGYTTNAVVATIPTSSLYHYYTDEYLTVSVPPLGKITLVADWDYSNGWGNIDLDLFTYLPQAALGADDTIIGNRRDGADWFYNLDGVFEGNLYAPLDPSITAYRTRWYHEGGNQNVNNGVGTEAVAMAPAPGLPLNPYFNTAAAPLNQYDFYLNDYGAGGDDMAWYAGPIVVRLWRAGLPAAAKISGVLEPVTTMPYAYSLFNDYTTTCDSDGVDNMVTTDPATDKINNADNEWLYIGNIIGKDFNLEDTCVVGDPAGDTAYDGIPGGGLPYRVNSGMHGGVK